MAASLALAACGSTSHRTTGTARRSPSRHGPLVRRVQVTLGAPLRVGHGGALHPSGLALNSGDDLRLTLRDTDGTRHVVTFSGPAVPRMVRLAPHAHWVVRFTRVRTGRYPIAVDGRARGRLVVGAQGGP